MVPHNGYVEVRDLDGFKAYGKPFDRDSIAAGVEWRCERRQ